MTTTAAERSRVALDEAWARFGAVELTWLRPSEIVDTDAGGWSLAADALRFVTCLVELLRPRSVLEMGSGLSTRVLARACGALDPPASLTSLENDPEYWRRTASQLEADGLGDAVALRLCPVVVRRCHGRQVSVYHLGTDALVDTPAPELILVDGPPLPLGGREGAGYQAVHLARPGTIILLDDAKRADEQAALQHVAEAFGDAVEIAELPGFEKGMAALLVTGVIDDAGMPVDARGGRR